MNKFNATLAALAFSGAAALHAALPATPKPISYDVDPPVVIDGKLADWQNVPVLADMSGTASLAYNRTKSYDGDKDLSGIVKMLWQHSGLFISAQVFDDKHVQAFPAKPWAGDHVDLRLDMTPDAAKDRETFGDGQFQLIISPGDFQNYKPEVRLVKPQGKTLKGCRVEAEKTADGYNIEAFIPWETLEVKGMTFDKVFAVDVLVSDSDDPKFSQQNYKILGPLPFTNYRDRLVRVVLADGSGNSKLCTPEKVLSDTEKSVNVEKPQIITFELTADEVNKFDYLLNFQARAVSAKPAGFGSNMLNVEVNGKMLQAEQLFGLPATFTMRSGRSLGMIGPSGSLTLPWSNSFEGVDKHKDYAVPGRKSCDFAFSLAGLLKEGKNTITFKVMPTALHRKNKFPMAVGKVALTIVPKGTLVDTTKPPTGKLDKFEPETPAALPVYSTVQQKGNAVAFKLNDVTVTVKSEFLTKGGKWGDLSNTAIKHTRKVERTDAYILVRDKFVNTSNEDLVLLQKHTMTLPGIKTLLVGGTEVSLKYNTERALGTNCTVLGLSDKYAVGMIPWCDALSIHGTAAVNNGAPQLADFQMAIGGNAEYTSEFIIVPWLNADYYSWINQARRIIGSNYPITLLSGFWNHNDATKYSIKVQKKMIDNFGINAVTQSNNCVPDAQGRPTRGTDLIQGDLTQYHAMRKLLDKHYPQGNVKQLIYFHCYLDTTVANLTRYANDRMVLADGSHTVYSISPGGNYLHCILPTEGGWAEVGEEWIDMIINKIGADGIFWDEFVRSNVEYVYNKNMWDGVSADVNRNNGTIKRKKSSVALLSLEWRLKMVRKLRAADKALIINGAPATHTMRQEKLQSMFETGSISNVLLGHLGTPVALGDHLTERKFTDAWKVMLRALDFGGLYCVYVTRKVYPEYPTMTKWMYPFTPIELHKGYLIGQERIITKNSGLFGWGDNSDFEAVVFGPNGQVTDRYPVKKVVIDGKTYAEVRIPGLCAAVIIRK
ncbi:MAG: hypothetical protein E7047_03095 [Lentisphaerae bacterium]|nr:hypothetical protein [Lentisphaerota bacterium]